MVETSKLYEAKISATKHGATGFGICWDLVLLCLIQYFLTAPVPPCWNRNTYYVPLYVGYNLVCLFVFKRNHSWRIALSLSRDFGLWTFKQCWLVMSIETFKVEENALFFITIWPWVNKNRELNVAIQMKNVLYRFAFLNSWHHFRVKEKTRHSNQTELGNKQA